MPEGDARLPIDPMAIGVRPAMADGVGHPTDRPLEVDRFPALLPEPGDAAH